MQIQLDQVGKHYQSGGMTSRREVLKEVSLTINQGDGLAVLGPSGSGKSTLLNLIGTLDKPTSGTIRFDGEDAAGMDDRQLAAFRNQKLGFVFQLHHLLPQFTLLENVLIPLIPRKNTIEKKQARSRAFDLLASVGLQDKIGQRPGELSVGECQRGAVVRALINEPELILADEPTGSLDRQSAEQMGELLSGIHKDHQVTMVIVTHSQKLANRMGLVYQLEDGKMIRI